MSFAWGLFSEKQLDVITNSTARLNLLEGSVRSGKTVSSLVAWINYVRQAPEGELLMVGKTERTLKRNALDPLQQIVGTKNYKLNQGKGELSLFGRRIYLAGANDERSEGKIRGMTIAGAYGDELSLYPESFFTMLLSRLSVKGARLLGTTNPDSPYHWLKSNYLDRAGELDLKSWHFNLEDNLNLDQAYIDALKKEYTGLWYKRFILGLWVLAEGAIYDMWDESQHVIDCKSIIEQAEKDRKRIEYDVAIDYATASVMTFGLYASIGETAYLLKEFYWDAEKKGRQKTDGEFAEDLVTFLNGIEPKMIYLDPSAASFKAELKKNGLRQVRDADNDVINGIRVVGSFLQNDRFFVDKSCKDTRKEFSSYVWDKKAQEKGEDKPLKKNDHCLTGDTLVNTTKGDIPIKDLVGQEGHVYCMDAETGKKTAGEFYDVRMTRETAEVFEITLEDGRTIKATADHLIMTQRGWVELQHLTEYDYIIDINDHH